MDNNLIVEKVSNYFIQNSQISAVYLFGSRVKGKERKNSDVDIAVLFEPEIDTLKRFECKLDFANDLEDILGLPVDIIDMESAELFFLHQVMLNKVLILEKNRLRRVEFEVSKRREYFDLQPYLKKHYEQALLRIEKRCNNG